MKPWKGYVGIAQGWFNVGLELSASDVDVERSSDLSNSWQHKERLAIYKHREQCAICMHKEWLTICKHEEWLPIYKHKESGWQSASKESG